MSVADNGKAGCLKEREQTSITGEKSERPAERGLLTGLKNIGHIRKNTVLIRVAFLILAIAAGTGELNRIGDPSMQLIWEYDENFLEDSFVYALGPLAGLGVLKGVITAAESVVAEPSFVGSKIGSMKIGAFLSPIKDSIEYLWDFFGLSVILIGIQLAIIKTAKFLSLKLLVGAGALCCVVGYTRRNLFGRIGFALILTGVMFYVIYPLFLFVGASAYEQHKVESEIQLAERIGIMKERADDIDIFSISQFGESVKQIGEIFRQGTRLAWERAWSLAISYLMMLVIIPLFSLGICFFMVKKVLKYLDMHGSVLAMDTSLNQVASKLRLRPRATETKAIAEGSSNV